MITTNTKPQGTTPWKHTVLQVGERRGAVNALLYDYGTTLADSRDARSGNAVNKQQSAQNRMTFRLVNLG